MKPKFLDIIFLIAAVIILIIFSIRAYSHPGSNKIVHIKSNEKEWYYPLTENRSVSVSGTLGLMEVEINAEKVHVSSAPCKEKICIKQGEIAKTGAWIACLPNSVLITIEAQGNEEWDSISF